MNYFSCNFVADVTQLQRPMIQRECW